MFPPPRNIRRRRLGQERRIIALPILEQSSKFRVAAVGNMLKTSVLGGPARKIRWGRTFPCRAEQGKLASTEVNQCARSRSKRQDAPRLPQSASNNRFLCSQHWQSEVEMAVNCGPELLLAPRKEPKIGGRPVPRGVGARRSWRHTRYQRGSNSVTATCEMLHWVIALLIAWLVARVRPVPRCYNRKQFPFLSRMRCP